MFRALLIVALAGIAGAAPGEERFIAIGTGGVTGVYFPAGQAMCRRINAARAELGLRCAVEPTAGSVENIEAIAAGTLEFGLVQADLHADAVAGAGRFAERQIESLRSVLSLHAEVFTLLAREESGILSLSDLRGKRVNVGTPGSGQRATLEGLLAAEGLDMGEFAEAAELLGSDLTEAFCAGRLDALIYIVGHPNPATAEAIGCGARALPVTGPVIDGLVGQPHFSRTSIPAGTYPGQGEAVESFGLRATLLTAADMPEAVVAGLARVVLEDPEGLGAEHPALSGLDPQAMVTDGLTAPLHPGALAVRDALGLGAVAAR
ncbi:MAG: TAXI family TRAP transporter solute-binding subunit [Pseudomonadota bacterium]